MPKRLSKHFEFALTISNFTRKLLKRNEWGDKGELVVRNDILLKKLHKEIYEKKDFPIEEEEQYQIVEYKPPIYEGLDQREC